MDTERQTDKSVIKILPIFVGIFLFVFIFDQCLKFFIVSEASIANNLLWQSKVISIVLVFNNGVAFSMLSFLGDSLKYIQLFIVVFACTMLLRQKVFFTRNYFAFGLIFGGGCSNILDRFTYGGVVDYIYWHFGFKFAVFNLADVLIDLGVGVLLLKMFLSKNK